MGEGRTVLRDSAEYPHGLRDVRDAPASLRVRGSLGQPGVRRVSVVGTRRPNAYGLELAAAIARDLARAGASVVSGGAEGIDAVAHRATLDARGHTVAVFGCGLDVVYPAGHRALFERIIAGGGALVSEYEDDARPARFTFPQRNRIVSGMSDAVVVVQAPRHSGALVTARLARRQGVPVFAVPGDVRDELSAGCLDLLRTGAQVAATAGDVLGSLGLSLPGVLDQAPSPQHLALEASALLLALGRIPRHADELARVAGLSPGAALAGLLALEVEGLCEQRPGHYFLRRA